MRLPGRSRFGQDIPGLVEHPLNRTTPRVFVAATRMNDGKTTTCLGLTAALGAMGLKVGYIKPIAQRIVQSGEDQVDEDSLLLNSLFALDIPVAAMSPVAIGPDFTRQFLDEPEALAPQLKDRISRAFDRAAYGKDIIVVEGSGHAGVGSVFGASNADNAKTLGCKVILVAAGGIGRPIDELALNKALFDQAGVQVIGAILNKVQPDKIDFIREYAGRGLRRLGIPLLGVLPLRETLAFPNLEQVADEIGARWIHRPTGMRRVRRVIMGAMSARRSAEYLNKPGTLLIVSGDREKLLAAMAVAESARALSGILFSNGLLPPEPVTQALIAQGIALMAVETEAFAVTARINNMTVKTTAQDEDKIPLIRELVANHVDLKAILAAIKS